MPEVRQVDGQWYRRWNPNSAPEKITQKQAEYIQNTGPDSSRAGVGESAFAGMTGMTSGVLDAYYALTGDDQMREGISQEAARQEANWQAGDPNTLASIIKGGTEIAPYVAAGAAVAPMAGTSILGQVGAQGATAGLLGYGLTPGSEQERNKAALFDTAITATGAGVGGAVERIASAIIGRSGQLQRKAMDKGMQLSPGQAAGNQGILARAVEPAIETMGGMANAQKSNDQLMKRALGRALGQADDAIDLSSEGLKNTREVIGRKFDVLKDVEIPLTDDVGKQIREISKQVDGFDAPRPGRSLTGEQYKKLRRQLSDMADRPGAQNTLGLPEKLEGLVNNMDQAFAAAAGPEKAAAFKTAREQWKVLKTATRGSALTPDGNLRPGMLNSAIDSQWGDTLKMEQYGGLDDVTRELMEMTNMQSSSFAGSSVGSSGTGERSGAGIAGLMAAGGATGTAGYLGYDALNPDASELEKILAGIVAGAAGPAAIGQYGRLGNLGTRGKAGQMLGPLLLGAEDELQGLMQ